MSSMVLEANNSMTFAPFKRPNTLGFGFASTSKPPSSPSKRRKRSETPEAEQEMDLGPPQQSSSKRIKSQRFKSPARPSSEDVDLGKMLGALSKPALINILTSLTTQQPALKPVVASLIPPPSLEAYTEMLAALEKKLTNAVPMGSNLRQEYIWGRIRTPLEEYVQENKHHLSLFTSSNESSASTWAEIHHPSTVFAFLVALTHSVKRLEAVLPRSTSDPTTPVSDASQYRVNPNDPFTSSLIPQLINAWHVLVTKASIAVNQEGRIWSAETLRSRLRQLEELCQPIGDQDTLTRRAIEGVKDRLVKEIGWLVSGNSSGWQAYEQQHRSRRARSMSMEEEL